MKSVLLIGVGEFGSHIAKRMSELRCEVMAVDKSEEQVNKILPYVSNAIIGDSTNEDFLNSLGVSDYDICIVALGSHFQTSLEVTSHLKEMGAKKVVSRATNDVQMKFLLRNGADEVVYPEKHMAQRVAARYASDSIIDFIRLDDTYSIFEVKVPKEWIGKTLAQLDLRKKYNINILTIKRGDKVFVPTPEEVIKVDDISFAVGEVKEISRCFRV